MLKLFKKIMTTCNLYTIKDQIIYDFLDAKR